MRRQPARIVDGCFDGRFTGVFELICPGCGDHPYLDYTEVPPRLQWLRGPRALGAALAAYHKHIGASPRADGDRTGSLGPASGRERRGARAAAGAVSGPAADMSWIIRWEAS